MNAAVYATERAVDIIAAGLGIDSLELRRRNAVTEFPSVTVANRSLDSGDYLGLLQKVAGMADYPGLRRRLEESRRQGRLVGCGLALFNEHSGTGSADYRRRGITTIPGTDAARVTVTKEGRIEIRTSAAEAGQDHAGSYRQVAAQLGMNPDLIDVFEGDTDSCPPGTGTFVSRGGVGVLESVVQALQAAAAEDLAPGTDVVRVADLPSQVFPSGAHLAVVEVDPTSFVVRITRYIAVEDCGQVVNQDAVEGQVRGGVAMGIGNVLFEEHVYSEEGQILTSSMLDYLVPLTTDVPHLEMHHVVSPSPLTTLGSKGVGEGGTIGAFAAVANAVAAALGPAGLTLTDLPYSPSRLFHAFHARDG
jgi:carbon-monoxide dehydrogenase large subunit